MRTLMRWLSLFLIFIVPWENILNLGGIGRISRAAGLIVAGFWVVTVFINGKLRKPHIFHMAFYLFILWNMISVFWSLDPNKTISRIETYLQLLVFVLILWDLYSTLSTLKAGLQAYVLGAYVSVISTIYNYIHAKSYYYDRFAATGFNPNDLAIILVLGMPVAWYLATTDDDSQNVIMRIINFVYIPAATFAVFLTASRAALIGVVFSALFILVSLVRFRLPTRILIIMVLVSFSLLLQNYIPQSLIYVLSTKQASLNGRDLIWRAATEVLFEHPFLGVGSNAFGTANLENGEVAHNVFLAVLVETGVIGFSLLLFILAIVLYQLHYLPKLDMMLWLSILLIFMVGALTHNLEARKQTWLFLNFLIANGVIWQQKKSVLQRSRYNAHKDKSSPGPFTKPVLGNEINALKKS